MSIFFLGDTEFKYTGIFTLGLSYFWHFKGLYIVPLASCCSLNFLFGCPFGASIIRNSRIHCAPDNFIVTYQQQAFCLINNGHKFIYKIAFSSCIFVTFPCILWISLLFLWLFVWHCLHWYQTFERPKVQSHQQKRQNRIERKKGISWFVCIIFSVKLHVKLLDFGEESTIKWKTICYYRNVRLQKKRDRDKAATVIYW